MGYRTLRECVEDLARTGQLARIDEEIDPYLEAAEIQRRVYAAGGPAVYFANVRGCKFPMVSNLFGTLDRARFIFRDTLEKVRRLIDFKIDPASALRNPLAALGAAPTALGMLPRFTSRAAVLENAARIDQLPQVTCWPGDGGPFITLPQVYTEDPEAPGWRKSNLGMYRIQLSGGEYRSSEVGMHYQIHRGIGVHHSAAVQRGEKLRANVFVGGAPAMTVSAVMPLPEGLPELSFAGALAGHRIRMTSRDNSLPIYADADFCISGSIDPARTAPEGPFGDHLGYYSNAHPSPVLNVEAVHHRNGAIWPFTVVGRPPQEDTTFGALIHEITGPVIRTVLPGVKAVHAVDAAGVHPLLLAVGSERYTPYADAARPQELLTQANAILGQGQMSLAKYLWIAAADGENSPDVHEIAGFLQFVLARIDFTRDLHFQTCTTIDTLDYSGDGLNQGSKLVVAAAGPVRRELWREPPRDFSLPAGFSEARLAMPGVMVVSGPKHQGTEDKAANELCARLVQDRSAVRGFPLIVLVDDAEFAARTLNNFLWVTFTRSNPAVDIDGVGAFTEHKHWGCAGPLVIDARIKPHHAAPLVEDAAVSKRVDRLAAKGGPLHGIL